MLVILGLQLRGLKFWAPLQTSQCCLSWTRVRATANFQMRCMCGVEVRVDWKEEEACCESTKQYIALGIFRTACLSGCGEFKQFQILS